VGWRLLHARAREMGKDVLVISADRQVRAVAKAAGFKIAESQESPVSGKSRLGSRPSRTPQGSRSTARARMGSRSAVESRPTRQKSAPKTQGTPATNKKQPPIQNVMPSVEEEMETLRPEPNNAPPPTYEVESDPYDMPFEFRVHPSSPPSASPLAPHLEDEDEPDPFLHDVEMAKQIREAAQSGEMPAVAPPEEDETFKSLPPSSPVPPPSRLRDDPFAHMEDIHTAEMPEQRASQPSGPYMAELDDGVPDITDYPTDIHQHEVEDLGDQDDILLPPEPSPRPWSDDFDDDQDVEQPRIYGAKPRASRSGVLRSQSPAGDLDDEDTLMPVEDRDTLQLPPPPPQRPSGVLSPANKGTRGAQVPRGNARKSGALPPSRIGSTRNPQATRKPVAPARPAAAPAPSRASATPRRNGRGGLIAVFCLLLLFLIAGSLFYFGTSATITIAVQAKPFSPPAFTLNASTSSVKRVPNSVPAEVLQKNFSVSDQGTATGKTNQGNSYATGTVVFTNNGSQQLTIPTFTPIMTSGANAVTFQTMANAVLQPSSSLPIPVQATQPGGNGNVGPNTITVIPPDSLTKIAQYNNVSKSSVNLSITNPDATSGGGAASVVAATSQDIANLTGKLHKDLQNDVRTWLNQVVHKGDVNGKVFPDVLDSSKPLPEEQISGLPAPNTALSNPTFTGKLTAHISVLVVRQTAIQNTAAAQLNAAALKQHPASILATQLPVKISKVVAHPSADGQSLSLTVNASGSTIPLLSNVDTSKLTGKSIDQAKNAIANGETGPTGILPQDIKIDVFPSFIPILPFQAGHITIKEVPKTNANTGIPNGQ
jgi:hypothetical protein